MRKKIFIYLILILSSRILLACPGCAGSMDNPKESIVVWILSSFIILTYIPFFILYRIIIKNRNPVKKEDNLNIRKKNLSEEKIDNEK